MRAAAPAGGVDVDADPSGSGVGACRVAESGGGGDGELGGDLIEGLARNGALIDAAALLNGPARAFVQ